MPLGLDLPDTPETAVLGDEFRKTRTEEVVRELLGTILLEPTVLLFDDAHWMDDASSDLLRQLTEGLDLRAWLILVTRLDQPTGFAAPESSKPVVIELEPLDASHAAALAHAATDDLPLLPHELEALIERADGNPLFLQRARWRRRGRVKDSQSCPTRWRRLMMARIDRLSPVDRRVLRCAAVIGATFQPALVGPRSRTTPVTRTSGADWRSSSSRTRAHSRFRHALVRDAAYEGLPYRRRATSHERVGETIERAAAEPEDEAALLSLHFFHAHEFEKAWRYSCIAGERAAAIYANVEAAAFFERALAAARRRRDISTELARRCWKGWGTSG